MKFVTCTLLFLGTFALNINAKEIFFDCQFEASKMGSRDPDAKSWENATMLQHLKFVYQTEPPKVLDGPGSEVFWGEPRITVRQQEIEFEWRVKAKPLDRTPMIALSVNRFSGKALQSYSMLESTNRGPLGVHWARSGRCEIFEKKL